MNFASLFTFGGKAASSGSTEIPEIFPLTLLQADFVRIDVQNIYSRILTDVLERTQGIGDDDKALLWDNCMGNESQDGLVTLLAKAMSEKSDLFVVYDRALKVIRKATSSEQSQIQADYKTRGESKAGAYITFKNYHRTDMIKLYSALEYCDVSALYKAMNLSKAVQFKLKDLRGSVGLTDSLEVKVQAQALAKGLSQGKDVMLDAGDTIETATPDLTATNSAMDFIDRKRSFYLGLPSSWITGQAPKGLGDSGEGDARAVERGLKGYYFSIVKPVVEAIFGSSTTFKSEDFRQLSTTLEALKTFEITSDELLSQDNKRRIVNKLLGLPENEKGDAPEKAPRDVTPPVAIPAAPAKPAAV